MFRKTIVTLLLTGFLLSACAGLQIPPTGSTPEPGDPDSPVVSPTDQTGEEPVQAPWEPAPGDEALTRGEAFVESTDLLILESFPPQYTLQLSGSLPTPCHQLRVEVSDPDEENRIEVDVYSLVDPGEVCIQVLEPFEANVPLGSFESGNYTVWVNGEQVSEIAAP